MALQGGQLVPEQPNEDLQDYNQKNYREAVGFHRKTIVYVGGLADVVADDQVMDAFICFGEIVNLVTPKDPVTEKHRGFCFVEYEDPDDAAHAMDNMNDCEFFGRVLKVNLAKPHALKHQAVWVEADQWYERTLAADAGEVEMEIRQAAARAGGDGKDKAEEEPKKKKARMIADPNKTTLIAGREFKSWG